MSGIFPCQDRQIPAWPGPVPACYHLSAQRKGKTKQEFSDSRRWIEHIDEDETKCHEKDNSCRNNVLMLKGGQNLIHIEAKLTGGTKNETQDIMTNMAEGRYTLRMNGPRDLDRRISNPYAL